MRALNSKYNAILEGESVNIRVKKDGEGRIMDINRVKQHELQGNSLVLTLDKKIQFLSERTLEAAVRKHQAKSGMALVMDPFTGELLAVSHYPAFNPNNFGAFSQDIYRNRSFTDAFEPGSVMKVFTVAAALEKGFKPKAIFFCENGKYRIGKYTIHDTHPQQWLSLAQIIKFSSNIGAAKIQETLGEKPLYDYLTAFGFGQKTRAGCPGETSGSLPFYKDWTPIDAGAISFGQGLSASAIQIISGISAIANGGTLMKPMLIKRIIDPSGKGPSIL